jgi:hypothetical protein
MNSTDRAARNTARRPSIARAAAVVETAKEPWPAQWRSDGGLDPVEMEPSDANGTALQ